MKRILIIMLLIATTGGAVDTGTDNEVNSAAPDLVLDYESNFAGKWNPTNESRALIRFNADSTDETAIIKVSLYRRIVGCVVDLYEITETWDSDVTWDTQPDIGVKAADFTVLYRNIPIWEPDVYHIEVDRVPEFGWMFISGDIPPTELYSFESAYPPELTIGENGNAITAVSLGAVKAAYR